MIKQILNLISKRNNVWRWVHNATCKRYVSLEFLKGTWSSFFAIANITSLRADKLLLIACIHVAKESKIWTISWSNWHRWTVNTWVSFRRSPVEPLLARRSLPARSIRFRTPSTCCSVLWKLEKEAWRMFLTQQKPVLPQIMMSFWPH